MRHTAAVVTVQELLIARNPDPDSHLPYLVRLPLGPDGLARPAVLEGPAPELLQAAFAAVTPTG